MKTRVGRLATLALGASFGTAIIAVVGHAQNAQNMNGETVGQHFQFLASALPAPYATPASAERSKQAEPPSETKLTLPPGFHANLFATGLSDSRWLYMAPNGDVFLAEAQAKDRKSTRLNSSHLGISYAVFCF